MTQQDEKVRNLQLRQNWIEEEVAQVAEDYNLRSSDEAFQSFIISMLFNVGYEDIQPEEVVDGGQDKQIDIIRIEDDQESGYAHIHIVQAKNTTGFSSTTLVQIANGLAWIFERTMAEVQTIENEKFKNKITEIRDIRRTYGNSNLDVTVYYATRGDASNLSNEYLQERRAFVSSYSNIGLQSFNMREVGAFELYELLNNSQRQDRKIDLDLRLVYDVNRNSIMEYGGAETRALICTITGTELARISQIEPRDAIFDMNVRPFYGSRGKVNHDIKLTCISDEANKFWFLNNGITMTCDKYDLIRDPDNPVVKIKNAQIVNGCQTTVTIRESYEQGELRDDVRVLIRVYATDNPRLIDKITLTTNNQNRITDRDLRANDEVQRDFQHVMQERYNYLYERKNKEYRGLNRTARARVVPNEKAAQAYLAIVRRKPSIARGYLARIWSEHYAEIFGNATAEDLLACFKIYQYCFDRARDFSSQENTSRVDKEIAVYGAFHLSRIMGNVIRQDKWGKKYQNELRELVLDMGENEEHVFRQAYIDAFMILAKIREESIGESPNPALYFKASAVERSIERRLNLSS